MIRDQYIYILGASLASMLGFVLLYLHSQLIIRRNTRKYTRSSSPRAEGKDHGEYIKTSVNVDGKTTSENDNNRTDDIIIVGAGVAGAALAHTLGKVPFVRSYFIRIRFLVYACHVFTLYMNFPFDCILLFLVTQDSFWFLSFLRKIFPIVGTTPLGCLTSICLHP